jgi:phosphatidylinositol-binding clathrin assembly protein
MSHVDATTALKIYKTFCRDTEKVVAYLGIAKKLQNVTHIQIPNLKHVSRSLPLLHLTARLTPPLNEQAPVSLAGSLEEYLNDPNFETNRKEYKENKRIADGGAPSTTSALLWPPLPFAKRELTSLASHSLHYHSLDNHHL